MKTETILEARILWSNTLKFLGKNDFQTRFFIYSQTIKQGWAWNIDIFSRILSKYFVVHVPFLRVIWKMYTWKYRSKWRTRKIEDQGKREFKHERANEWPNDNEARRCYRPWRLSIDWNIMAQDKAKLQDHWWFWMYWVEIYTVSEGLGVNYR